MRSTGRRTIEDFGAQWQQSPENSGYYASLEMFGDICGPLLSVKELHEARAADIGSGTGRIVGMLAAAGVAHVVAIEPSAACDVLRRNVAHLGDRVDVLCATGEAVGECRDLDFVFSVGVLHHIPQPSAVVRAAFRALRPGGRIVVWVYGREGNGPYLAAVLPLRMITTRLPDAVLWQLATGLTVVAQAYMWLSVTFRLPLWSYLTTVFGRLDSTQRRLVIYDQLNPHYTRYYRGHEVRRLLEEAGFENVALHHRHGYSWTAVGCKPPVSAAGHRGGRTHEL